MRVHMDAILDTCTLHQLLSLDREYHRQDAADRLSQLHNLRIAITASLSDEASIKQAWAKREAWLLSQLSS